MIRISFTESDIEQLRYERFHHPHPRVQRKTEAVLLKSTGMKHKDICEITGICGNTLRSYLRDYADGGVERLKEVNFFRQKSELEQYREAVKQYFREHPPADMKEATAAVERITGIRRSENRVRVYLKSIGMKRRKVGMIPAKADPEEQERFVKEELNPRLKEAEEGRRAVFLSMRRTSC
jgi:transposase